MNRRTTATLAITASLVVLMSGCAGVAAQGGQLRDDLSPVAGSAELGLARGHVIVRDDLSPNQAKESIEQAVQPDAQRAWSAEARREFHGATAAQQQQQSTTPWTAEARREFHGATAVQQEQASPTPWTDEARREFHSVPSVAVDDDLSPSNSAD